MLICLWEVELTGEEACNHLYYSWIVGNTERVAIALTEAAQTGHVSPTEETTLGLRYASRLCKSLSALGAIVQIEIF